jgi:putative DNA primase/helicase
MSPSIIAEVALRLLGEPKEKHGNEWRYGNHGSLSIRVDSGKWYDHEAKIGGQYIELIISKLGGDENSAKQWLAANGLRQPSWDERIVTTYDYVDENGTLLFQVVRLRDPKDFRQRRKDADGQWIWKTKGIRKVLYRLPELIKDVAAGRVILIPEGEKDVDTLRKHGFAATTSLGGAEKWSRSNDDWLKGANVVLLCDNDNAGRSHVAKVAASLKAYAAQVRTLDLAKHWPGCPPKSDVSDWFAADGTPEKLQKLIDEKWSPKSDAATIAALAKMPRFEFDRVKEKAAKDLGISVPTLVQAIKERRAQSEGEDNELPHWKVAPAKHQVDGAQLLDAICKAFTRFVILPKHGADMLALWVLHTWVFDSFDISPYLAIVSPTRRCGKSTVMVLLLWLTRRGEKSDNMSAASIFRGVEEDQMSLLVDEYDQLGDEEKKALASILNGGHTRLGYVSRIEGDPPKRRRFRTFCPKAFAAIGRLADTHEDRSVMLRMKRRLLSEKVEKLSLLDCAEWQDLRSQALRWSNDNTDALKSVPREDQAELHDRANDNWHTLRAVAHVAGGEWPTKARDAAIALSGARETNKSAVIGEELLADVRTIFGAFEFPASAKVLGLTSAYLLQELVKDAARPWADWKNGKPMTARALAQRLGEFDIYTQEVSYPTRGQGYALHVLQDAFDRHLVISNLGTSGLLTQTGTSDASQTSGLESNPDLCKGQETAAAVSNPDLPSFERGKSAQGIETPNVDAEPAGTEKSSAVNDLSSETVLPSAVNGIICGGTCEQCNLDDGQAVRWHHKASGTYLWLHKDCKRFHPMVKQGAKLTLVSSPAAPGAVVIPRANYPTSSKPN